MKADAGAWTQMPAAFRRGWVVAAVRPDGRKVLPDHRDYVKRRPFRWWAVRLAARLNAQERVRDTLDHVQHRPVVWVRWVVLGRAREHPGRRV